MTDSEDVGGVDEIPWRGWLVGRAVALVALVGTGDPCFALL